MISFAGSYWTDVDDPWIGGKDDNGNDHFSWIGSGEPLLGPEVSSYWSSGEPDHEDWDGRDKDCVYLFHFNEKLRTSKCSNSRPFICEKY